MIRFWKGSGEMVYDVLFKNGRIIDGRGNPWYKGNVAIKDGQIAGLGIIKGKATEEIDLKEKYICPGFIDTHTHSDIVFFINSSAQSKVRQGVTTEVTGNCGMSAAPYSGKAKDYLLNIDDFVPFWETIEEYLEAISSQPKTVNLAPLIGHGTLRAAVVGLENRPATEEELYEMNRLLCKGLEKGAFGLSTGLYFSPGSYAQRKELVELARTTIKYGTVLASHIRDEGVRTVGFISAVKEIIDIARSSGAALQISHIKAFGPDVWGLSEDVLDLIEDARVRGIDIGCDQYPYTATGGSMAADTLPTSYQSGKTLKEIAEELKDKKIRETIKNKVAINIEKRGGAANQTVVEYSINHDFEGKTLQEISEIMEKSPADTLIDMLIESKSKVPWISYALSSDDVDNFIKYPGTMICSDGASLSIEGVLSQGHPHPRNFGTFPRVLKNYVKERGILKLEDAIRKMTSLPAQKFNLYKRGVLEEGYWADIVVFDLDLITDASFEKPKQYPDGIFQVLVNGKFVIKDKDFTGILPGRVARRK